MSVEISIDFGSIEKDINKNIENGVNESLIYLKDYAKKTSPIDTGEYNKNHKITQARDTGSFISGMLSNNTPYAEILEYGVGGATYNYHRYGRTYMSGIGARVYTRTQDNNLRNIVDIITKNLSLK